MNLDSYTVPTKLKSWLTKRLLADGEAQKLLNEFSFTLGAFITTTSYLQKLYNAKKYVSNDTFSDTYASIVEHIHEKLEKGKAELVTEKPVIKILDDLGTPESIFTELALNPASKKGSSGLLMLFVTFIAWSYTICLHLATLGILALSFFALGFSAVMFLTAIQENGDFAGISGSSVFAQVGAIAALPIGILLLIAFGVSWQEKRLVWKTAYTGITYGTILLLFVAAGVGFTRLAYVKSPENRDTVSYSQKLSKGERLKIEAPNSSSIKLVINENLPPETIEITTSISPYFFRNWIISDIDTIVRPNIMSTKSSEGISVVNISGKLIASPFSASKYEEVNQEIEIALNSYDYQLVILGQAKESASFQVIHEGFRESDIKRVEAVQTEYCSESPIYSENNLVEFKTVCSKSEETTGNGSAVIELQAK